MTEATGVKRNRVQVPEVKERQIGLYVFCYITDLEHNVSGVVN
jgi:hypothetical protein